MKDIETVWILFDKLELNIGMVLDVCNRRLNCVNSTNNEGIIKLSLIILEYNVLQLKVLLIMTLIFDVWPQ